MLAIKGTGKRIRLLLGRGLIALMFVDLFSKLLKVIKID